MDPRPRLGARDSVWGFLLTILLASVILGRIPLSPIKTWQWMLLSLGLTQVPVPIALVIVGWFFALAWHADHPPTHFVLHNGLQILLGLWTAAAVGCLIGAIYDGLAVQPDMQVEGAGSSTNTLNWYIDHVDKALPTPSVLSIPIVVWKIVMLLWALWLAGSIVKWAPWAWRAFSAQGIWHKAPPPDPSTKTTVS